jgi:uncharacterized coiled-coil protein SlyX
MGGFFKRDDDKNDKSEQQRIGETIKNLSDQVGALKLELQRRNAEIERLTKQIADTQAQKATSDAARTAQEETIKATEEVLRDSQSQVRQLESRIAQLAAQATEAATQAAQAAGGIAIGATAWVRKAGGRNLRRRAGPGLSADVHDTLPPGTELAILEGPVKVDDYTWWRVLVTDGREGWVAGEELVAQPE